MEDGEHRSPGKSGLRVIRKALETAGSALRVFDTKIERIPVDRITYQEVAKAIRFHILADHLRIGGDRSENEFHIGHVLNALGHNIPSKDSLGTAEYQAVRDGLNDLVHIGALRSRLRRPTEAPEDPEGVVYSVGKNRDQLKAAAEGRLSTAAEQPGI